MYTIVSNNIIAASPPWPSKARTVMQKTKTQTCGGKMGQGGQETERRQRKPTDK